MILKYVNEVSKPFDRWELLRNKNCWVLEELFDDWYDVDATYGYSFRNEQRWEFSTKKEALEFFKRNCDWLKEV